MLPGYSITLGPWRIKGGYVTSRVRQTEAASFRSPTRRGCSIQSRSPRRARNEAAVLAIRAFREHDCEPGIASRLAVEVRPPSVTHTVMVQNVRDWLDGAAKSPKEKVVNETVKEILRG